MLTFSSHSICLAKAGGVYSPPISVPSRSSRTRKPAMLIPQKIQFVVFIVAALFLSMGEASPRQTRRRRARSLVIESDPLSMLEGKGSGAPKVAKGGKGAFFEVETSERLNDSTDYFSLAPITVEGRLSEAPAFSPGLEFPTPTNSPSSSFSDVPSLSPTKSSSDAPSLGPSTSFLETSTRLSLAPSTVQVSTGATAGPSSVSPASQITWPTTVAVSIPTASPTPENGDTDEGTEPEDGLEWRNMTSDSTGTISH